MTTPPREADPEVQWFLDALADLSLASTMLKESPFYTPGCLFLSYRKDRARLEPESEMDSDWGVILLFQGAKVTPAEIRTMLATMESLSVPWCTAFTDGPMPELPDPTVGGAVRKIILAVSGQTVHFTEEEAPLLLGQIGDLIPEELIKKLPR